MIKFSGLKFAFGVSLLVHGTVFSVIYYAAHRQGGSVPPVAAEPASVVEMVVESDQPAAAIPETPPVVVVKPQATITVSVPVKPAIAPPPPEPPKPALEEKPEVIPVALGWELDPAEKPAATANVAEVVAMPVTVAVPNANPSLAAGESMNNCPGYMTNPKPVYPPEARRRKQQGLVILNVFITNEGRPQRVEVAQSSGYALLDEAALTAIKQWRFTPARIGNITVSSQVEVPIRFRLLD
jgi:protein TonB